MNITQLLSGIGTNFISKEALALCVEKVHMDRGLAQRIREDPSFDVVIVTSPFVEQMEVHFAKTSQPVPLFRSYGGDAVQKALQKLHCAELYRDMDCHLQYEYKNCLLCNLLNLK